MLLSIDRVAAVKAAIHTFSPEIGSSHLAEIIAAGFGFKTNASLRAKLKGGEFSATFDFSKAVARAAELGYQLPELPASVFEFVERGDVIKIEVRDHTGTIVLRKRVKYVPEAWLLFSTLVSRCEKGWTIGVKSEEEGSNYDFLFECLYKADLNTVDLSDQLRIYGTRKTGEAYEKRYARSLDVAWNQLTDIAHFMAIGERVFVRPVFGSDVIAFHCLKGHYA